VTSSLDAEGIEYCVVSFADTGAKDVTEYLENHSPSELARLIGTDWIYPPDGVGDAPMESSPELMSEVLEAIQL
jgi:hypothetical protein